MKKLLLVFHLVFQYFFCFNITQNYSAVIFKVLINENFGFHPNNF